MYDFPVAIAMCKLWLFNGKEEISDLTDEM